MKREDGYYWVKINDEWTIGEYHFREENLPCWLLIGTDEGFSDEDLETVGPAIQKRDWFSFF
ncbi:MAG: hypothetical protein EKK64_01180 [Neisseriaceae bacterium]|nr:MAG: hypothetical protein EKK64_01180 [Neisseriaceae bacterium]